MIPKGPLKWLVSTKKIAEKPQIITNTMGKPHVPQYVPYIKGAFWGGHSCPQISSPVLGEVKGLVYHLTAGDVVGFFREILS